MNSKLFIWHCYRLSPNTYNNSPNNSEKVLISYLFIQFYTRRAFEDSIGNIILQKYLFCLNFGGQYWEGKGNGRIGRIRIKYLFQSRIILHMEQYVLIIIGTSLLIYLLSRKIHKKHEIMYINWALKQLPNYEKLLWKINICRNTYIFHKHLHIRRIIYIFQ